MFDTNTIPANISDLIDHTAAVQQQPQVVDTTSIDEAIERTEEQTLAEREHQARMRATGRGGVLARIIERGQRDSAPALERILNEVPQDMLVGAKAIGWSVSHQNKLQPVGVTIGGNTYSVHPHAFGQAASRYDVPKRYLDKLLQRADWSRDLASATLNTHAQNDTGKMLVRTFKGKIRAFLSDRYRRIDSRPLLVAFVEAIKDCGMQVVDARCTDVRLSVRAVFPQLVDIHGDPNLFGIEWVNSDYGAGKHEVRVFFLRTACLNGMTGEAVESQVHLGSRVSADVKLSKDTLELDTATLVSAMGDIVRDACSQPKRKATIERVRKAAGERIELGDHLPSALRRALSKQEQDRMRDLFDSSEAVMLPPAPTTFRLSNVLSWMANTASSTDRALELQSLAGQVAGI